MIVLFGLILLVAAVWKYMVISSFDGGWELQNAYVPKTLTFLRGQDPYSTQPYAAPYPPLMFVVLGGIVKLATLGSVPALSQVSLIGWDLRVASLVADLLLAVVVFYALRFQNVSGLRSLIPPGIYLLSPGLTYSYYVWFHADVFGYLILGFSLLAFVTNRILVGASLLSLAVAFKLQPILSVLLIIAWAARKYGVYRSLPTILSSAGIMCVGIVLPLFLAGYSDTIIGFNLSYGSANPMASFTLMNLFNGLLPTLFGLSFSTLQVNQIWIGATAALAICALGVVWTRGDRLNPVHVVLLGLLFWLIPLRTLYPYYLIWAFVPFLFIGNVRHVIVLAVMFEALNTLANWSWNVQPNPYPQMASVYGYFVTSLAFAAWGIAGAFFLFRTMKDRSSMLVAVRSQLSAR